MAFGVLGLIGPIHFGKDAPAWVQAVGSVVGIFTAVGIAAWQYHVSKLEAAQRDIAARNFRYTRANREMQRLQKIISRQLKTAREQSVLQLFVGQTSEPLSYEAREVERECHLMPDAGGECLTAFTFYEDAQDLLFKRPFKPADNSKCIELLEYAEQRSEIALTRIHKYLFEAEKFHSYAARRDGVI